MKNFISILILSFITTICRAQLPFAIAHQGVICDSNNEPISFDNIDIRISVFDLINSTTPRYQETHTISTDDVGYFKTAIGRGQATIGSLDGVTWDRGAHYVTIEGDINKDGTYVPISTVSLYPVPIANYALTATMGSVGFRGPAGPQGPQGPTGPAGAQGMRGPQCPSGPIGEQGDEGPTGAFGPVGQPGINGFRAYPTLGSPPNITWTRGLKYMDDGSNRADGKIGMRYFDGVSWIDL